MRTEDRPVEAVVKEIARLLAAYQRYLIRPRERLERQLDVCVEPGAAEDGGLEA